MGHTSAMLDSVGSMQMLLRRVEYPERAEYATLEARETFWKFSGSPSRLLSLVRIDFHMLRDDLKLKRDFLPKELCDLLLFHEPVLEPESRRDTLGYALDWRRCINIE